MPDTVSPPPCDTELEPPAPETRLHLNTIFLGGLFLLALLAASYVAAEIVLPIVLAFVLNAVFQPVLRFLQRIGLPRVPAALLIVLSLVAGFAIIGYLLSSPLAAWVAELPQTLPRLQERLHFLGRPIASLQGALAHLQHLGPQPDAGQTVAVQGSTLAQRMLVWIETAAEGAFATLLILFFVLVAGDQFLRRLVEILPDFKAKRQAVDISQQIERDISIYLATITMMNTAVGVLTGLMAWVCGLGGPLLWGTAAFLLNYVPILGPTAGVIILLVTGLVTLSPMWFAFVPAALYLLIHIAEGETITPILLARRFTVNPVLVMLGVIFWYWMWGVAGAILSTPMLAMLKITCDRIDGLKAFGHFIGGEPALVPAGAGNGKPGR
jgi:predicted PurR-regulated permease PerM